MIHEHLLPARSWVLDQKTPGYWEKFYNTVSVRPQKKKPEKKK